jgi:hypothetical protein
MKDLGMHVGSALIGAITAFAGFPIYNFKTNEFSLSNTIILAVIVIAWTIFYNTFIKKEDE